MEYWNISKPYKEKMVCTSATIWSVSDLKNALKELEGLGLDSDNLFTEPVHLQIIAKVKESTKESKES